MFFIIDRSLSWEGHSCKALHTSNTDQWISPSGKGLIILMRTF